MAHGSVLALAVFLSVSQENKQIRRLHGNGPTPVFIGQIKQVIKN